METEVSQQATLKHPDEWAKEDGMVILDSDGWRFAYGNDEPKDYNTPITRKEFQRRAVRSTTQILDMKAFVKNHGGHYE